MENSNDLKRFNAFLECWSHNTQMHLWRYVFASQYVKEKAVLDVACGVGYGSDYLSRCGAKQVVGVDLGRRSLQFARSAYVRPNVNFVLGDALALPIPDHSLNVIISFETIEHLREQEVFLAEIRRVLKIDGVFICSTPNIEFSMGHIDHVRELMPLQFYEMLRRYFRKVDRYGQYITYADRKFEIAEARKLKFRLKRQKAILLKRIGHWMNKSSFGIYLKPSLRWVLRKIIREREKDHVEHVEITESLVGILDSKYAVRPIDEDYPGVLFGIVAVCKQCDTEIK